MLAASVVVAMALAAAPSPGLPGIDPAREVVLVEEGVVRTPVMSRGAFGTAGRGLRLTTPAPYADSFALWSTPGLGDGLVRARFIVGDGLKSDLLVRAAADVRPGTDAGLDPDVLDELDGGYGISLERDEVRLVRWEHRMHRFLGAQEALSPKPKPGSVIEVVVVVVGPWLQATIYDESFRRLAHVAVLDRGFVQGGVGVRMTRGQDATSALLSLSVGPAGPPSTTTTTTTPDLTMDGEGTGAGAERLVGIAPGDVARLPASLKSNTTLVREGVQYLVTDVTGVEQLRRAGIPIVSHRTQMPFLHVDRQLRKSIALPPTKTSRGFRVDESYKDAAMVEALLRAYAERFPTLTKLEEIGRSREGRPILGLLITRGGDADASRPAVLLDAAHHGGELMSTEFVLDAIQQLIEGYGKDKDLTRFVDNASIWCVPLINVDGNHRYIHESRDYDRKNARDIDNNARFDGWDGVDLYRQYPVKWGGLGEIGSRSWPFHYRYRGPEAASEPEIQAMIRLAERERFAASIDFHTAATKILVPYTDPSMTNPATNEAWIIAERIADALPAQVNRRRYEVQRNLYPVDGTAQDWFRFTHGTVALLVEAPQHNPLPYDKTRNANVVPGRGTWKELLRAVVDGPAVQVRVVDSAGAPVEAHVFVAEQAPAFGERWTTRPRDGLATRLLPAPGTYTIVVEVDGKTVRQKVDVDAGVKRVDVRLK